jgi:mono/diheme cytochrome c family protein
VRTVLLAAAILVSGSVASLFASASVPVAHFANPNDDAAVAKGKQVYREECSSCHGRSLEGQPLWQLQDQYAGRRAPAHDASGHTWQHSDEDLFYMTKFGRFPQAPKDVKSYMPAFEKRLSDAEIVNAIAFIKSRWPLGLRISQSMLNPGFAGMPRDADKVEWTLPPTCTAAYQRWKIISR